MVAKAGTVLPKAERVAMLHALDELTSRVEAASMLGISFGGNRDLYGALGYKKTPVYSDYVAAYKRNGIARAVVKRPVGACWREAPEVVDDDTTADDTQFEAAWKAIVKDRRVWHYLSRVDRLSRVGSYGILLLGFDDGKELSTPIEGTHSLIYLSLYSEGAAAIKEYEADPTNPRFNQPTVYSIKTKKGKGTESKDVHFSRVIHVVEDSLTDDVIGESSLEVVLNRIWDLEKLVGGSAEMFWQGAFPGYNFKLDPQATAKGQGMDDVKTEIMAFVHKLQRWMRTKGVDVQTLTPQVADPASHVNVQLQEVSAATMIPQRILLGSERGELASTQDRDNWAAIVRERQVNHCEPVILRPFIDRLVEHGALPTPSGDDYAVSWPDPAAPDDKARADTGLVRSQALSAWANTAGAELVIPPDEVPEVLLGMSTEDADKLRTRQEEFADETTIEDEEVHEAPAVEAVNPQDER